MNKVNRSSRVIVSVILFVVIGSLLWVLVEWGPKTKERGILGQGSSVSRHSTIVGSPQGSHPPPAKTVGGDVVWADTVSFTPVIISLRNGMEVRLQQRDLVHILERHHPRYFDASQCKRHNTLLPASMGVGDVVALARALVVNHQDAISKSAQAGSFSYHRIRGTYQGISYVMGLRHWEIVQLYPVQGQEAEVCYRKSARLWRYRCAAAFCAIPFF